jgi:hypothetical protein
MAALPLPLAAHAAQVATLAAGSTMHPLSLSDQHDQPVAVRAETRWLVFTSEKPVSDMVSAVLSAEPAGVVDRLRLVYVADISGMPALVTRMFALPKLRELRFPIGLVRDPAQVAQVADIPRQTGSATVLRLEAGRIVQSTTASNAAELRAVLGLPPVKAMP